MSHSFKQKEIRRNQKLTNIPRQALQDPEENGEAHLLLFISCSIENKTDTIHLEKGHERRKETEKVVGRSGAVRSCCPRDQISLIYLLSIKLVLLALGEDAELRVSVAMYGFCQSLFPRGQKHHAVSSKVHLEPLVGNGAHEHAGRLGVGIVLPQPYAQKKYLDLL